MRFNVPPDSNGYALVIQRDRWPSNARATLEIKERYGSAWVRAFSAKDIKAGKGDETVRREWPGEWVGETRKVIRPTQVRVYLRGVNRVDGRVEVF